MKRKKSAKGEKQQKQNMALKTLVENNNNDNNKKQQSNMNDDVLSNNNHSSVEMQGGGNHEEEEEVEEVTVLDSNSIVLVENPNNNTDGNDETNANGIRNMQEHLDYGSFGSGLTNNENVHRDGKKVSSTTSLLSSSGNAAAAAAAVVDENLTSTPVTVKVDEKISAGNVVIAKRAQSSKESYTNRFVKDLRLNILVAGAQGLGKSTLLRALVFGICRYYHKEESWIKFLEKNKKVKKTKKTGEIARLEFPWDLENDRKLIVTVVDSIGFGDTMNEKKSFMPIQNYIKEKFQEWRRIEARGDYDESEILQDPRVHCCLYFMQPSRVRNCDKINMFNLQDYVPVVPVIAKTDSLTIPELNTYIFRDYYTEEKIANLTKYGHDRREVIDDIEGNNNNVENQANVTTNSGDNNDDEEEEEEDRQDNGVIKSLEAFNINYFRIETRRMKKKNNSIAPPNYSFEQGQHGYKACVDDIYAIVARDEFDEYGNPQARPYPWGNCRINDRYHSDFERLENMLFKGDNRGMIRLRDETEKRYRAWRKEVQRKEYNHRNVPLHITLSILFFATIIIAYLMYGGSNHAAANPVGSASLQEKIENTFARKIPNDVKSKDNASVKNDENQQYSINANSFQSLEQCKFEYDKMYFELNNKIIKEMPNVETKLKKCESYMNDILEQQATEEVLKETLKSNNDHKTPSNDASTTTFWWFGNDGDNADNNYYDSMDSYFQNMDDYMKRIMEKCKTISESH